LPPPILRTRLKVRSNLLGIAVYKIIKKEGATKMRKAVAVIIAFLSLTTFIGSSFGWIGEKHGKRHRAEMKYTDPMKPIRVKVGKKFVIVLESNPTTGYQWQLAQPLDESKVKGLGSKYKGVHTKRVGAGGRETWNFRSVGQGKTAISFQYVRPWEKGVAPGEMVTFEIEADF